MENPPDFSCTSTPGLLIILLTCTTTYAEYILINLPTRMLTHLPSRQAHLHVKGGFPLKWWAAQWFPQRLCWMCSVTHKSCNNHFTKARALQWIERLHLTTYTNILLLPLLANRHGRACRLDRLAHRTSRLYTHLVRFCTTTYAELTSIDKKLKRRICPKGLSPQSPREPACVRSQRWPHAQASGVVSRWTILRESLMP